MNPFKRSDHFLLRRMRSRGFPILDRTLIPLSESANHSRLWLVISALLATGGGRFGRRAAMRGLLSIGITSALVNGPLKLIARRRRPDPPLQSLLRRTPLSASFPSGHAAAAGAFATAVSLESPALGVGVGAAAAGVAISRVYVGVHYPSDVIAGAAVGAAVALGTTRLWPVAPHEPARTRPTLNNATGEAFPEGKGVTFVVNPDAGPALSSNPADDLRKALPQARVIETSPDLDLAAALELAAGDARALGMAGGDGSVNTAGDVALAHDLPLVVVPSGTLNHLARDLGLDTVADAVRAVEAGVAADVDVALIDGKPFLNTASFGSYVELVDAREKLESTIGKWPAVLVALVKVLRRSAPLRVEINGQERAVWMIFIGNCQYQPSGFVPSWRERLDDGLLDVRIVDGRHPWARTRLVIALLTGTLAHSRVYQQSCVRRLDVRFLEEGPYRLARDGETFDGSKAFVIEKARRPLRIYVPPVDPGPALATRSGSTLNALQGDR